MANPQLLARDNEIAANVRAQRAAPLTQAPAEPIVTRRFQLPDLSEHGQWLVERLSQIYPGVLPQVLISRLNTILYNNEFLFLYQRNAVAVAQLVRGNTIQPKPNVQEWFVFVRDRDDPKQVADAATFYADFARWGRAQDCDAILLSDTTSDVPADEIKKHVGGRLAERRQLFVVLKKE